MHHHTDAHAGKSGSCRLEQMLALFSKETGKKKRDEIEQQCVMLEPPAHRLIVSSAFFIRQLISKLEQHLGVLNIVEMSQFVRSFRAVPVGRLLRMMIIQNVKLPNQAGRKGNVLRSWIVLLF